MTFKTSDGGRGDAGIKDKKDCTVRALALATGTSYEIAHAELAEDGRSTGKGHDFPCGWLYRRAFADKGPYLGFLFMRMTFGAVKGEKRMDRRQFCRHFTKGVYIVQEAHHVFTVIDGVAHDTAPSYAGRCVYGAWKVERKA